jgi:dTDP-4-amino-4,6-dideoxygalactose transaminase
LDEWLVRREEVWSRYDEAFAGLLVGLPPAAEPGNRHARHLYTLTIDPDVAGIDRDTFMQRLHGRGIGTGVHYRGVHLHQYYRDRFGYAPGDFPNATWISERTVSLPLSPHLDEMQVRRVLRAVPAALATGKE